MMIQHSFNTSIEQVQSIPIGDLPYMNNMIFNVNNTNKNSTVYRCSFKNQINEYLVFLGFI